MDTMYLANPTQHIPIIWSQWVGVHEQTERTWRTRLFTRPWRPHEKYDSEFIPKAVLYRNPGSGHPTMIIAHPAMKDQLLDELENMSGPPTQEIEGVTPQAEWPRHIAAWPHSLPGGTGTIEDGRSLEVADILAAIDTLRVKDGN